MAQLVTRAYFIALDLTGGRKKKYVVATVSWKSWSANYNDIIFMIGIKPLSAKISSLSC